MNAFTFYNPTRIFFGEGAISKLEKQLKEYGKTVLLTYGGGSIKKNGVYDAIMAVFAKTGKTVVEVSDIMPNPRTEKVYEGIKACKEHHVDFILAAGGGSVIDCTKMIAAGAKTDEDFWDAFFVKKLKCQEALPFGAVLTLAGTGSEMDCGGVITQWDTQTKISYFSPLLFPKFSILDPTYTYSLPKNQMINGAMDTLSHAFEQYFSRPDESNLSDDLAEAVMKNVIENLNTAIADPTDYVARSNLMWCATMGLNDLIGLGKEQDWITHKIEHALSAFYDVPHGAGLAVVHPNYMLYTYKNGVSKYARFARNIWHVDPTGKTEEQTALEGILRTKDYLKSIGAPSTLGELGVPESSIDAIAEKTILYKTSYSDLKAEDVKAILRLCL